MKVLAGYDNRGIVYDSGDFILRKVNANYFQEIEQIYHIFRHINLDQLGIVETEIDCDNNILKHKKYLISYPFEWTANMYKDAVLFHLNLFLQLDHHELTLKDAIPNNIVFHFYKPFFVDFLSIVQTRNLKQEKWLLNLNNNYKEPRFSVFDVMFIPFVLIPFMAFAEKKYALSRQILSLQACNCGRTPQWKDLYYSCLVKYGLWSIDLVKHLIKKLLARNSEFPVYPPNFLKLFSILSSKKKSSFTDFCLQLIQFVEAVDVSPPKSGYLSYYDAKGEDFDLSDQSCWQDKQKAVAKIIDSEKPDTMLDIGANTGWFSILAARRGINVIATDVDESSIDTLYLYAKQNHLQILPLIISFTNMTRQIFGVDCNDPEFRDRNFKAAPLYLPATERLQSDMVLCLGLLHHLVLGEGNSICHIFEVLSELSRKTLVMEYVDLEDELIVNEPSFFKRISDYKKNTYNIEVVINQGKRYFTSVETVASHPDTRTILVFNK